MIHMKDRPDTILVADVIECDRCHKKYKVGSDPNSCDIIEIQEFNTISFSGGFGSVFGDESHVECDLCQHCLKELIGDICRIT